MNLVPQQTLLPGSLAPFGVKALSNVPSAFSGPTVVVGGVAYGWDTESQAYKPAAGGFSFLAACVPMTDPAISFSDISGRGADVFPKRTNTGAFTNPGYLTTAPTIGGATLRPPRLSWNPARESFIMGFVLKKATPGANQNILALNGNNGAGYSGGWYLSHRTGGGLRLLPVITETSPYYDERHAYDTVDAFTTATAADVHVTIAYDHVLGIYYIYKDGIISTETSAFKMTGPYAPADAVLAGPLAFGSSSSLSTFYDAQFRAFQFYKFASGSGLPINIGEVALALSKAPATPLPDASFAFRKRAIRVSIVGQSLEGGGGTSNYRNRTHGFGCPLVDSIRPQGGMSSPWPIVASTLGRRGTWLEVANTARGGTSIVETWVGHCRAYAAGLVVKLGSYVTYNGRTYKATSVLGSTSNLSNRKTLTQNPVTGEANVVWTDLGVSLARDTDGRVYEPTDTGRWDPNGVLLDAMNRAHPNGAVTGNYLTSVAPNTGYDINAVFVSLGQEDASIQTTGDEYRQGLLRACEYMMSNGLRVVLGMTSRMRTASFATQDAKYTTDLIPAWQSVCTALASNPLFHVGPNVADLLGGAMGVETGTGEDFAAYLADGIHFNMPASRNWAKCWSDWLVEIGW